MKDRRKWRKWKFKTVRLWPSPPLSLIMHAKREEVGGFTSCEKYPKNSASACLYLPCFSLRLLAGSQELAVPPAILDEEQSDEWAKAEQSRKSSIVAGDDARFEKA